ncbi:MAG: ATP synthase F1 subunit delta [Dehalococcoidia bacterium]
MADYQAGKRYAQAVFGIAVDQGTVATWRAELEDVAHVLAESAMAPVFGDTRVSIADRLRMVERVLDVSPLALNLARLLVSKGRAAEARAVAVAFAKMADQSEGIEHASITTAVALDSAQVTDIEQKLGASLGKRVLATATVDPSIVGGVVVRVGDKLLDGSVRTRLRHLRQELQGSR